MVKKKIQSPKFTPIESSASVRKEVKLLELKRNKMFSEEEMKKFMKNYEKYTPAKLEKIKALDYTRQEIINEVMKDLKVKGSEKEINDVKSQMGEAFKKIVQAQMKNGKTIEEIFYDSKKDKEKIKKYIRNSLGRA